MKKKVVFYITYYPGFGGIEKVTTYLANYLSNHGVDVTIISFCSTSTKPLELLSEQVKLLMVPNSKDFLCEENVSFVRNYFANNNVDKIIYQDCYSNIHIILEQLSLNLSEKLFACEHSSPLCSLIAFRSHLNRLSIRRPSDWLRWLISPYKKQRIFNSLSVRHKHLLRICNRYILLSNNLRAELNCLSKGMYGEKVIAISNPVTVSSEMSKSKSLHNNVLFVGRLVEDKGINFLLDIWNRVECEFPNWTLTIVGDGHLMAEIKNKVAVNDLHNVKIVGASIDVEKYYRESDILIMTSIFEGFPLVLLEAMANGVVPMAFNSFASLEDIFIDDKEGCSIRPYNTEEYSARLKELMENPVKLRHMSFCAYEKSKEFSIERIGSEWLKLLL